MRSRRCWTAAPGIVPRSLVAGRTFDDERPVCVEAMYVAPGEAEEAQWVARRILEIVRAEPQFTFEDIAVLVRNTEVLAAFTDAFEAAGIPYVVNRGQGFYDTREVNDLTQLLRVIANPRDEIALAAVLRSPLVGASDEDLLRAADARAEHRRGADAAPLVAGARLTRFRERLRELAAAARAHHVRPAAAGGDRRLRVPAGFGRPRGCEYRQVPGAGAGGRGADVAGRVRGGTGAGARIESARAGCAAGGLGERGEADDGALGEGARVSDRVRGGAAQGDRYESAGCGIFAATSDWARDGACRGRGRRRTISSSMRSATERKQREEEESHRLLYVAMTRAEQHLGLSFSGQRPGNWAKVVAEACGCRSTGRGMRFPCSGRRTVRSGGCG